MRYHLMNSTVQSKTARILDLFKDLSQPKNLAVEKDFWTARIMDLFNDFSQPIEPCSRKIFFDCKDSGPLQGPFTTDRTMHRGVHKVVTDTTSDLRNYTPPPRIF